MEMVIVIATLKDNRKVVFSVDGNEVDTSFNGLSQYLSKYPKPFHPFTYFKKNDFDSFDVSKADGRPRLL